MTTTSLRLSTSFEATNQQLFSIFFNQTLFDTNSHFTHSFSKLFLTMCHENHKTNTKKTRKIRNKMSTRQGYQHKNEQKQIKGHETTKTRNNKATTKTHEKLQPWREHAKNTQKINMSRVIYLLGSCYLVSLPLSYPHLGLSRVVFPLCILLSPCSSAV